MFGKILMHISITSLYCFKTGCDITFVDRAWLFKKTLTEKILKMATLLKVRGIKSSRHKLDEFVSMSFYFPSIELTNRLAYAHIYGELYIIERLKANLLMSNDILAMERVIIDLANKFAKISIC